MNSEKQRKSTVFVLIIDAVVTGADGPFSSNIHYLCPFMRKQPVYKISAFYLFKQKGFKMGGT